MQLSPQLLRGILMHKILALAAFCSASAFASCPDFAGTFNCTQNGGSPAQETIATTVQGGVTTYAISGMNMVADGLSHPVPGTLLPNGTYTANCTSTNTLAVDVQGPFQWGTTTGYLTETMNIYAQGTNIEWDMHMDLKPASGGPDQIQDTTLICTPVP